MSTQAGGATGRMLLRRGLMLEYATLGWNVVGVVVLAIAAIAARSVALTGFGVDSLIEIVASAVVVWQLRGEQDSQRERRALRIIAVAFVLLAVYIAVQGAITLTTRARPGHSTLGMVWLSVTVVVMFALAAGKRDTGRRLDNPVLLTESRLDRGWLTTHLLDRGLPSPHGSPVTLALQGVHKSFTFGPCASRMVRRHRWDHRLDVARHSGHGRSRAVDRRCGPLMASITSVMRAALTANTARRNAGRSGRGPR